MFAYTNRIVMQMFQHIDLNYGNVFVSLCRFDLPTDLPPTSDQGVTVQDDPSDDQKDRVELSHSNSRLFAFAESTSSSSSSCSSSSELSTSFS